MSTAILEKAPATAGIVLDAGLDELAESLREEIETNGSDLPYEQIRQLGCLAFGQAEDQSFGFISRDVAQLSAADLVVEVARQVVEEAQAGDGIDKDVHTLSLTYASPDHTTHAMLMGFSGDELLVSTAHEQADHTEVQQAYLIGKWGIRQLTNTEPTHSYETPLRQVTPDQFMNQPTVLQQTATAEQVSSLLHDISSFRHGHVAKTAA